jgi:centrosomal protein CEP41
MPLQQTNRHSTLQSVIRGIGELDMYEREKQKRKFAHMEHNLQKLQQDLDLPYLLLDLRTKDEYDQSHIITALNYPTAMLSRSVNNETPELLAYKNQPGKIIVVYDDEERIAPRAAQTLVQRGYDNLFMLSGGMKLAWKKFPEGLISGQLPDFYSLPTPKLAQSANNTNRSTISSLSNSTAYKKRFERDDIEKLNQYLEQSLMPHDQRYNSRMSLKSTRTNNNNDVVSVASSTRSVTSIHDKAWKP